MKDKKVTAFYVAFDDVYTSIRIYVRHYMHIYFYISVLIYYYTYICKALHIYIHTNFYASVLLYLYQYILLYVYNISKQYCSVL